MSAKPSFNCGFSTLSSSSFVIISRMVLFLFY
jgi:hypothetical protein